MSVQFPYLQKTKNQTKEEKVKALLVKILKIKNQIPYEVRIQDDKYNNLVKKADRLTYET